MQVSPFRNCLLRHNMNGRRENAGEIRKERDREIEKKVSEGQRMTKRAGKKAGERHSLQTLRLLQNIIDIRVDR